MLSMAKGAGKFALTLSAHFPDVDAPSAARALAACAEFVAGKLPEAAARTTLIVAAMEAGFEFETGHATELVERHLTEAAEASLRSIE